MIPLLIRSQPDRRTFLLYESGKQEVIEKSSLAYLEEECIRHGSSVKGRMDSFCQLVNAVQKPAVMISERSMITYFPTRSPKSPDCEWVCFNRILRVRRINGYETEILFLDGTECRVSAEVRVIKGQMSRCDDYLEILMSYLKQE